MEDLPLGRIAALVPEFVVKDLPLGRTLMMMIQRLDKKYWQHCYHSANKQVSVLVAWC